jgi:serine/threonine-protein kinase
VIVFSAGASGLWKVSAEGGVPEPLTTKGEGDIRHRWPQFLPGGETVLFTLESTSGFRPALVSLATGEYRVLEEAGLGRGARFLSSGHIVYAEEGVVYALAFDSERLEIQGRSVPVLEGVYIEPDTGLAYFTSSETSLSYVSDPGPRGEHQLLLVDRSGAAEPLVDEKDFFRSPRYSPDGTKIAVGSGNQGRHLWVYDLQTGARDRLTSTSLNGQPVWTPDGNRIAFARLYVTILLKSVGTEGEDELHTSEHAMFPSSMTPDGATLAFYEFHSETRGDIWMLPLAGKAEPWLVTEATEITPRFSPDGGYVAYASDETDRFEIYVKPYPEPGEKVPVSSGGGTEPVWSPDGRELFYRNGDSMMVVTVEREPSFHTTRAEEMFSASYVSMEDTGNVSITYDVAPDGQHFAMIDRGTAGDLVGELYVVTDWSSELERLVPTDNGR